MSSRQIQLHFDGDRYFSRLESCIDQAKEEVLLETYILDLDPIGLRILQALDRASKRGVKVFLLIDGIGSYNWLSDIRQKCQIMQIPLKVYHPLPFQNISKISWKNLRRWLRFFRKINKRDHRKFCLIDKNIIFIGSFNISQVHSRRYLGSKSWRDSGVEIHNNNPEDISNTDIEILHKVFFKTFYNSLNFKSHNKKFFRLKKRLKPSALIRQPKLFNLNTSLWARIQLARKLKKKLRAARSRILITNAYFLPRRFFLKSLRSAAERGVFVGLILPAKTDAWFVREASRSLYYRLIKSGVHIYEFQPQVLHAKTFIIDDLATVGSFNLNHRSMIHDLEIEAIIPEAQAIQELVDQWDKDAQLSKKYTLSDLGNFPWPQRILSRILYWFRYIL